jgi:hypothetical protein
MDIYIEVLGIQPPFLTSTIPLVPSPRLLEAVAVAAAAAVVAVLLLGVLFTVDVAVAGVIVELAFSRSKIFLRS